MNQKRIMKCGPYPDIDLVGFNSRTDCHSEKSPDLSNHKNLDFDSSIFIIK